MLKNETFIKDYKLYGFSTMTELIDAACEELRRKIAQERRAKWRQEAHKGYAKSNSHIWKDLDEEDIL